MLKILSSKTIKCQKMSKIGIKFKNYTNKNIKK